MGKKKAGGAGGPPAPAAEVGDSCCTEGGGRSVCLIPPQAGFLIETRREATTGWLKLIVVTLSLPGGTFFLYPGLRTEFLVLDYQEIEEYGIPIRMSFS